MQSLLILFTTAIAAASILLVCGQSGPTPPRLSIPGAIVAPVRSERVRVRRPVTLRSQSTLIPAVTTRILEEPKPVTESGEDEQPDVYLPQILREQQLAQAQQIEFQQTAAAFLNQEPNALQTSPPASIHQLLDVTPNTIAPTSTRVPSNRPTFNDFGIGRFESSQRIAPERPSSPKPALLIPEIINQPQRKSVIRSRPAARSDPRPQYEVQTIPVISKPRPKPIQARPIIDQNQIQDDRELQLQRRQRPVSQTIRKWRDENEDGSITWGYENDDGSFKEEFIGTDCITKGTYGYIDPDGNKREYRYETGIKCDPNARENEADTVGNGFVNYEDNKAILPNGIEIDMSQLGKKKSKRPSNIYRN